jgi:hypothetical protein
VQAARDANFTAVQGQGLLPEVLARVDPDSRLGCIAFTPNEEVNLLWARRVRAETRAPRVYVALGDSPRSLPTDEVHEAGAALLFAAGRPLDHWAKSLENGSAVIERWRHVRSSGAGAPADSGPDPGRILLLLTSRRAGRIRPVDERTVWRDRDEADVAILEGQRAVAEARLRASGWSSTDAPTAMPDVP